MTQTTTKISMFDTYQLIINVLTHAKTLLSGRETLISTKKYIKLQLIDSDGLGSRDNIDKEITKWVATPLLGILRKEEFIKTLDACVSQTITKRDEYAALLREKMEQNKAKKLVAQSKAIAITMSHYFHINEMYDDEGTERTFNNAYDLLMSGANDLAHNDKHHPVQLHPIFKLADINELKKLIQQRSQDVAAQLIEFSKE